MKKLQNNFTAPEQSKRLLELGVPADSADCVLVRNLYFPIGEYEIKVLDVKYSRFIEMHDTWEVIPCWSVGRLMEIFESCTGRQLIRRMDRLLVEDVKCRIAFYIHHHKFDFSKLEE